MSQESWPQLLRGLVERGLAGNDKQLLEQAVLLSTQETERARLRVEEFNRVVINEDGEMVIDSLGALREAGRFYAESGSVVPAMFRGSPGDCAVVVRLARRFKVDPLLLMQNCYIEDGRVGLYAKFIVGLLIASGKISGRVEYNIQRDPEGKIVSCQAVVTDAATQKRVEGTPITAEQVRQMGLDAPKDGQINYWLTMPEQMYKYRAGAWLVTLHYPEVILGLDVAEDLRVRKPADLDEQDQAFLESPAAAAPTEILRVMTGSEVAKVKAELTQVAEPEKVLDAMIQRRQAEAASQPDAAGASANALPDDRFELKPPLKGFASYMAKLQVQTTKGGLDFLLRKAEKNDDMSEQERALFLEAAAKKRAGLR